MQIKSYSIIYPNIISNASFFGYVIYRHCLYQKITGGKAFTDNPITQRFYRLANKELMSPSLKEWQEMKDFISDEVPELKAIAHKHSLRDIEYEICILVLLGFSPSEMVILTERSKSDISNIRHRLYQKITGENGSAKDFDAFIRGLL